MIKNILIVLVIVVLVLFHLRKNKKIVSNENTQKESNYIVLTVRPGVDPLERGSKYGDPLNNILTKNNIGEVTGGGTMLEKPDENGHAAFEFSDIEVRMSSRDKSGLNILANSLIGIGYPESTEIQLWDSQSLMFSNVASFKDYLKTLN